MSSTSSNNHQNIRNGSLKAISQCGLKKVYTVFILMVLAFVTSSANADWWTQSSRGELDAAGSHFKTTFNVSNGILHIESYAQNGGYNQFLCCVFKSVYVESATMAYSLDGTNYVNFYKFGFDYQGNQTLSTQLSPYTTNTYTSSSAQWNYISYLPQVNTTLKEGLAGYKAVDDDVIKSQTGFSMYSTQNGWIGSLNYLEPGKGYMLYRKRTNDTAFYYPAINGSLAGTTPREVNPNVMERPVPGNFSNADNMTVAAIIATDFEFRSGDSVVAYVNGELRGKAKPIFNNKINRNTYFFNIGGDVEQSVVFMIDRGGEMIAQSSTMLSYRSNTSIGTLAKPLELHFIKQPGSITVFPNPFNKGTNISVDLRGVTFSQNHQLQLSVVDVAGRVVMKQPVKTISGTAFTTNWNGRNADGTICSKGIYFINLTIDGIPNIRKVVKQ